MNKALMHFQISLPLQYHIHVPVHYSEKKRLGLSCLAVTKEDGYFKYQTELPLIAPNLSQFY